MNLIFIYDVFTSEKFKGNQAGVVFDNNSLKYEEKQNLAMELHFSETVFVSKIEKDIWKLEYFTPKEEIDLCGHATIAAIYALFEEGKLGNNTSLDIQTKLGILKIYLEKKEEKLLAVWMEQDQGQVVYDIVIPKEKIIKSLGLKMNDLHDEIPIFKAYSGLWDLMIPLNSKNSLNNIKIDIHAVKSLSKQLSVISFHPFYLNGTNAYVRNFAPIVDIPEEAATGTSNGALTYVLEKLNLLKKDECLICHQGELMQRSSLILGKIRNNGRILVGGKAIRVLKGIYN